MLDIWIFTGFHDCVDSCDGCIRFIGIESNKGLEGIFDAANILYEWVLQIFIVEIVKDK
jgi:hypothetical protein